MNGLTTITTNISSSEDRFFSYGEFYTAVVSAIVKMGIENAHIIEMSDFYAHSKADLFRILSDNLDLYYNSAKEETQNNIILASSTVDESSLAMYKIDQGIEITNSEDDIKIAMEKLSRDAEVLEDLGFMVIKSLSIDNTIPAIFPNKIGIKLIKELEGIEE